MSCTKVLHALGGHPQQAVMPVDLAMRLCLSQTPPLYQLLGFKPHRPPSKPRDCSTRTSLRSHHSSSSSSPSSALRSCLRRDPSHLNRKRVVFADAKGLALTAVRLFIPEPPSPPATVADDPFNPSQAKLQSLQNSPSQAKLQSLQNSPSQAKLQSLQNSPSQAKMQSLQNSPSQAKFQSLQNSPSQAKMQGLNWPSSGVQRFKPRLGFPQPTVDLKSFASRLQEALVQLESCSVTERSLTGTVRVCNVSFEKAVLIRVTLDSWRSHRDIPCTLLPQRYGASDTDVFRFDVALPQSLDPNERLEFCVLFRSGAGAALHWDNNRGQNYRVLVEAEGSNINQGSITRHSFTRNQQRPPSWPWDPSPSLSSSSLSSLNVKNRELSPDKLTRLESSGPFR